MPTHKLSGVDAETGCEPGQRRVPGQNPSAFKLAQIGAVTKAMRMNVFDPKTPAPLGDDLLYGAAAEPGLTRRQE